MSSQSNPKGDRYFFQTNNIIVLIIYLNLPLQRLFGFIVRVERVRTALSPFELTILIPFSIRGTETLKNEYMFPTFWCISKLLCLYFKANHCSVANENKINTIGRYCSKNRLPNWNDDGKNLKIQIIVGSVVATNKPFVKCFAKQNPLPSKRAKYSHWFTDFFPPHTRTPFRSQNATQ